MRDINLKHLHYFWVVAREGSIAAASERLFVSPQTISAQLKQLEAQLQQALFSRRGTGLTLTPAGETALGYADTIFDLRRELAAALSEHASGGGPLRVGIVDVVPKLIATLILQPITRQEPPMRLVCQESDLTDLLARLATQKLDFVISDHPATPDPNLRVYNHELGETGISFMAAPALLEGRSSPFPSLLQDLPFLMPGRRTALRTMLESWLLSQGVTVRIAGEFDDSALIKAFGQTGAGVFSCPTAIEAEVARQYSVCVIGRTLALRERFYLISRGQRIDQEIVHTVLARAQQELFTHEAEPAPAMPGR